MNNPMSKRRRIFLATIAGASAAIAATAVLSAAEADAATDSYIALSYSAVDQSWGWGRNANIDTAVARSLHECGIYGDGCVYVAVEKNYCVAIAAFEDDYSLGRGSTANEAGQMAAHGLARSKILFSGCA